MAHSYERTYLTQRLGFADPDKKNPLHDMACQFLTQPEQMKMIAERFAKRCDRPLASGTKDVCLDKNKCRVVGLRGVENEMLEGFRREWILTTFSYRSEDRVSVTSGHVEFPIVKGQDQYKVTLGFIDVLIIAESDRRNIGRSNNYKVISDYDFHLLKDSERGYRAPVFEGESDVDVSEVKDLTAIVIEVKIERESVVQTLRQISFYREYCLCMYDRFGGVNFSWLLATTYDLSDLDVETLEKASVHWIKLGNSFDEFVKQQENAMVSKKAFVL